MTTRSLHRRGVAMVLVLGLVALTLGVAYALMRTQTLATRISLNAARRDMAREAAHTALALALRRMHDDTWPGVEQGFQGTLDGAGLVGYSVSYTTGDSRLTPSSPDFAQWPYRVTIVASGYASDPTAPLSRSEHSLSAVVQLVRRQLNSNSISAANIEDYTLYQVRNAAVTVQHPVQFHGQAMVQGEIDFCPAYPIPKEGPGYNRYFSDLGLMAEEGKGDHRPFPGVLHAHYSRQTDDFTGTIQTLLRTQTTDVSVPSNLPISIPNAISSYQLYSKGRTYKAAVMPATVSLLTPWSHVIVPANYAPDPQTNPLGVFVVNRPSVAIGSNTSIQGMLLVRGNSGGGDLYLAGNNISLTQAALPPLADSTLSWCLPVALLGDDFELYDGTGRTVTGLVAASDEFHQSLALGTQQIEHQGTVLSERLRMDGILLWRLTSSLWATALSDFQSGSGQHVSSYFPEWLGLNYAAGGFFLAPRLQFTPSAEQVRYFAPSNWSQPLFVPHASDGGLLWEVVAFREPHTP
jgi:Tfp pilus assembly protein PilX